MRTTASNQALAEPSVAALKALAARYGVSDLRVFGSYARGDTRPDSDLDLLVTIRYGPDVADRFIDFVLAAEDLLGMKVDVLTERSLDPSVHGNILAEARPL